MTKRRFPPPWTIEDMNDACFIVRDKNGRQLGYCDYEEEPGRRTAASMLTKDEARRLAVNFAKVPELLRGPVRMAERPDTGSGRSGRLKTQMGLTPYEFICKIWTTEPEQFILDPLHQMPGLNI